MDDSLLATRLRAVVGHTVPGVVALILDADGIRAQAAVGFGGSR